MQTKFIKLIFLFITTNIFCQEKSEKTILEFLENELTLSKNHITYLKENKEAYTKIYEFIKKEQVGLNEKKFLFDIIDLLYKTNYKFPVYTKDNYPGKEDGYPFEWWKNEKWIQENIRFK